jgi:Ca-activated chloride channel homolog
VRFRDPDLARRATYSLVGVIWAALVALLVATAAPPPPTVVVVHWANGHMADEALLPTFARTFSAADFRTASGAHIEVQPWLVNSGVIRQELLSRGQTGVSIDTTLPNPTLVTPVAEHWLYDINEVLGRSAVDIGSARSIASTWLGIATFREMAQCLGWPEKPIGYGDILALGSDPQGWGKLPCARAEWGRRVLLTYTDPNSSSTGRSVLFSLYSIAAAKPPEQLTAADVASSAVIDYLKRFQTSVAHYVPDTLLLSCEIFGGPRYGHFFFIAEDNLAKLYNGKLVTTDPNLERLYRCSRATAPLDQPMVMIYPTEGSTVHTHPAALVREGWVTREQAEAARRWVDYLLEEPRQNALMDDGFRPSTASVPLRCPVCRERGIDPSLPRSQIDLNKLQPPVGERIVSTWGDIKNPGVVVFVVDESFAMAGQKLQRARDGIIRTIDGMYPRNLVGLVTFAGSIDEQVDAAPMTDNKFHVEDALRRMQPRSGNTLFEAIKEGIAMAARAPAPDSAIRGVVVVGGGPPDAGPPLETLVVMASAAGRPIVHCQTATSSPSCVDQAEQSVPLDQVLGVRLVDEPARPVRVYFIGVGMSGADLGPGRVIAEATGGDMLGTSVDDLATVVRIFSGYN